MGESVKVRMHRLREVMNADLYDKASPVERAWLEQSDVLPYWWLELNRKAEELEAVIAERRAVLKSQAPRTHEGEQPSTGYIDAKRAYEDWVTRTIRVRRKVFARRAEVDVMLRAAGIDIEPHSVVLTLARIRRAAQEGDCGSVLLMLGWIIQDWAPSADVPALGES